MRPPPFRKPNRIIAQEPPDHGVVVARLHVGQAGGGVADVAGEAFLVGVGGRVLAGFAEWGVVFAQEQVARRVGGAGRTAQMVLVAVDDVDAGAVVNESAPSCDQTPRRILWSRGTGRSTLKPQSFLVLERI